MTWFSFIFLCVTFSCTSNNIMLLSRTFVRNCPRHTVCAPYTALEKFAYEGHSGSRVCRLKMSFLPCLKRCYTRLLFSAIIHVDIQQGKTYANLIPRSKIVQFAYLQAFRPQQQDVKIEISRVVLLPTTCRRSLRSWLNWQML